MVKIGETKTTYSQGGSLPLYKNEEIWLDEEILKQLIKEAIQEDRVQSWIKKPENEL